MRHRTALWLWTLPLGLVGGCLLPSFENVPADLGQGGSDSGGAPSVLGGAAGEPPQGGVPAGGEGNGNVSAPKPVADTYVVQQGKSLVVGAANGVLINDTPADLVVSDFSDADKSRPDAYDGVLDIAEDGSLTFKPTADFFGRYNAEYTVEGADGQSATAAVTFIVQPSSVDLTAVEEGVGGVLITGSATDAVGSALSALGDVNADGFDDFAVGAPGALTGDGSIYIVFGRPDFAALTLGALAASSNEGRFAVLAGSAAAPVGDYVSTAGRFDTDELADILVGSPSAASDAGRLFVVYGSDELKRSLTLAGLPAARGIALSGDSPGQQLGLHVAGGGDFNGDQKADLLAGLYPEPTSDPTTGGVCTILENPVESQALGVTHFGAMKDSSIFKLPQSLAIVGDVNDDGKDDWIATSTRNVALVFGQGDDSVPTVISQVQTSGLGILRTRLAGSTGVAAVAAAGDVNGDKHADFAYCDEFQAGTSCEVFFGPIKPTETLAAGDWSVSGYVSALAVPRLSPAGDLNQDGFADLLSVDDQAAYVVFGRDAGFGAVDVGSLGSDGFSLARPEASALGAVASIGDVNGDGYGDFAVGEPAAAGGAGYVYVVLGGPFAADQR